MSSRASYTRSPLPPDDRLPTRWFIIVISTVAAGWAGWSQAGPVAGISCATAVAVALHVILR